MRKRLFFTFFTAALLFVGCNKPQWHVTEQDVLVYTQMKSGATCVWDGGTMLALAHGPGKLTVYNGRGEVIESKNTTAEMGVIGSDRYVSYGSGYYLGKMKKSRPNGFGVLIDGDYLYIGRFKKGDFYGSDDDYLGGNAIVGRVDGEKCVPEFYGRIEKGKPNGNGILYENGIVKYDGSWKRGERSGLGCEYFNDSIEYGIHYVYDGSFAHDVQKGYGQLFKYQIICESVAQQNDTVDSLMRQDDSTLAIKYEPITAEVKCDTFQMLLYQGEWKDGMRHGSGTEYNERGITVYEGSWKRNMYDGKGTLYKEGKCIEGRFDEGRLEKEFKVSVVDQVKRTTNQILGKEVFDEHESTADESIATPESSLAASQMEFIESMMPELEEYAKEKIEKRVDKRFGFWNIVRMTAQPVFRKELKRADKAQKYFCKDLTPNSTEKWINAKIDYYNQTHGEKLQYVDLGKIEKNQIVTSEVARKVFDREAMEISEGFKDFFVGYVCVWIVGFIIGIIIAICGVPQIAGIIDGALTVIGFILCIIVSIFVNGPICNALESEISQMVLNNYMTYINSQDIITQMIGML